MQDQDTFTVADAIRYASANLDTASDGDAYALGDVTRRYWHCHDIDADHARDHRRDGDREPRGDSAGGDQSAVNRGTWEQAFVPLICAAVTVAIVLPIGICIGLWLATRDA